MLLLLGIAGFSTGHSFLSGFGDGLGPLRRKKMSCNCRNIRCIHVRILLEAFKTDPCHIGQAAACKSCAWRERALDYSGSIFASFTICAQRSISLAVNAASSAGVLVRISNPWPMRPRLSSSRSAPARAAW